MTTQGTVSPPKQDRARVTRKKLLAAAGRALCELGFAGTTTTVVAKRAGVSQGALYRHFGSKQQLFAATTEYLFESLIEHFREAFSKASTGSDPIARALPSLWAVFLTPELYAVVELYIAARTDEALREALVPVLLQHRENLRAEAGLLFPEAAQENPRFNVVVDSLMAALQGAAVSAAVLGAVAEAVELGGFLEEMCRRELQAPYGER
jgi:AcrR family transcriptional regulator